MTERFTIQEFYAVASEKLSWLPELGFRRDTDLEKVRQTSASIVFRGCNVALKFSADIRAQCVDARVIKVVDRKLCSKRDGGYSEGIYRHLINKAGYRGSPSGTYQSNPNDSRLEYELEGYSSLLQNAGAKILRDDPDSLD